MPMASTMPNRVDRLTVKPSAAIAGEGADDGDRHGRRRDQRRAEILQEDQDDDQDQNAGLVERRVDLVDEVVDEGRRVVGDGVAQALGEALRQLRHRRLDFLADLQRVRFRRLVDARCRRPACR